MPRPTFETRYGTIELEYIFTSYKGGDTYEMRHNETDEYFGWITFPKGTMGTAKDVETQITNYRKNLFKDA